MEDRRQIEIVVHDDSAAFALEVVDMATGRRIGALVALSFKLDAKNQTASAILSYLKLEGSPDGTVPPDHPDRVDLAVGDDGEPQMVVEEQADVVRFVTRLRAERRNPERAPTEPGAPAVPPQG